MEISSLLEKVRAKKPLVHHITNWVTICDCAQIVKSFGASPVMAHALHEAADMTAIASSLVLNIGTLTDDVIASMLKAGAAANRKEIPIVLDVCGAGATPYRDDMCTKLISALQIGIIKGNASEISRVAGLDVATKGVDSSIAHDDSLADTASRLSAKTGSTVVITGKTDIVAAGGRVYLIDNGHSMMGEVVGTGCMAASVIGTFAAVESDLAAASAAALACYGIAGEKAAAMADAPMEFKHALQDAVYRLSVAEVDALAKIR